MQSLYNLKFATFQNLTHLLVAQASPANWGCFWWQVLHVFMLICMKLLLNVLNC